MGDYCKGKIIHPSVLKVTSLDRFYRVSLTIYHRIQKKIENSKKIVALGPLYFISIFVIFFQFVDKWSRFLRLVRFTTSQEIIIFLLHHQGQSEEHFERCPLHQGQDKHFLCFACSLYDTFLGEFAKLWARFADANT